MPLYEFECEACGERFEVVRKFSDPPVDECPRCGKGPVRKLPSAPAIQFKGTGWYVTDYAKKDSTAPGKSTKTEAKEGGTEKSGASDKPAESNTSTSTSATSPAKTTPPKSND